MNQQRRPGRRQRGQRSLFARQPWAGPLLALGLVVLLYRRKETLSSEAWADLKE